MTENINCIMPYCIRSSKISVDSGILGCETVSLGVRLPSFEGLWYLHIKRQAARDHFKTAYTWRCKVSWCFETSGTTKPNDTESYPIKIRILSEAAAENLDCCVKINVLRNSEVLWPRTSAVFQKFAKIFIFPHIYRCIYIYVYIYIYIYIYTGCPGRDVPDFGSMFLKLKYIDITQNTYIRSWTVTEIMAREVWKYGRRYTLIDYQIHIITGRNMWFL